MTPTLHPSSASRSVRRTTTMWLVTSTLAVLTACAAGAPGVEQPVSGDDVHSALTTAAAQVDTELSSLDGDSLTQAVTLIASRAEAAAWTASGIDDAVGGPRATNQLMHAALTPLLAWTTRQRQQPSEFQLAGLTSASSGLRTQSGGGVASAFSLGFVAIGGLADSGVRESNRGSIGSDSAELPGGSATLSVAADGSVHAEMATTGREGDLSVNVTAATDLNPCPDADGRLEMSADVAVRVNVGAAGGSIEFHIDATGVLDDDANLAGSNYEYRQQYASYADGKGEFLDHSGNAAGELTVNRYSEAASAEFGTDAATMAAALAYMVARDLQASAEKGWSSGRCVDVVVTPSADPSALDPDAQVTIEAAPRSRHSGELTGGNIVATYTGDGTLDPTGRRVDAPATFDYVAPSETERTGTATFESRSRRGIGNATLTLSTGTESYTVTGTRDEYSGGGTICSLEEPFTIPGTTLDFDFTPIDRNRGNWSATGSIEDLAFRGTGTYSVTRADSDDSRTLVVDGKITVIAPDGSRHDGPADLQFNLVPTDPCS